LHKTWLGEIYEWAGEYRQLNISKDGFLFAVAARIPALMSELEKGVFDIHPAISSGGKM
jgi:cell filamentation protein